MILLAQYPGHQVLESVRHGRLDSGTLAFNKRVRLALRFELGMERVFSCVAMWSMENFQIGLEA